MKKDKLLEFLVDFEKKLTEETYKKINDIGYSNYCVGEINLCRQFKNCLDYMEENKVIDYINEKQENLDNIDYTQLSKLEQTYFNGMKNMCRYILREWEKISEN